jgi:hypothetical protein
MQTVVVFDCESDGRLPPGMEDGSLTVAAVRAERFDRIQCTCAIGLVLDASRLRDPMRAAGALADAEKVVCWRDRAPTEGKSPFEPLLAAFDAASLIVGYNAFDFDFPLLRKHYASPERYTAHRLKTLDPFDEIRSRTTRWPSLDTLLRANGMPTKNGITGLDAVRMWDEVQYAEVPTARDRARNGLQKYCENDVRCTATLATRATLVVPSTGALPGLELRNDVYGIAAALARQDEAARYQAALETASTPEEDVAASFIWVDGVPCVG